MSTVKKKNRSVLFVTCLSGEGEGDLEWLYRTLDDAVVGVSRTAGTTYGRVALLRGDAATRSRFVSTLVDLDNDEDNEAVDVFLVVHGSPDKLYFADGAVGATDLARSIKSAGVKHARMLYSTACYGASHADDFVSYAGFDVASGSKGVNANGVVEFPAFYTKWCLGYRFDKALDPENDALDRMLDSLAEHHDFDEVDSTKVIEGDESQKIGAA
jgi:hypothetical protein